MENITIVLNSFTYNQLIPILLAISAIFTELGYRAYQSVQEDQPIVFSRYNSNSNQSQVNLLPIVVVGAHILYLYLRLKNPRG